MGVGSGGHKRCIHRSPRFKAKVRLFFFLFEEKKKKERKRKRLLDIFAFLEAKTDGYAVFSY